MKRKQILSLAMVGMLLVSSGCGSTEEAQEETVGTAVEAMDVISGPMSAEYSLTGKVAAANEVQVFPLLAGQVLSLSVEEGAQVKKGQTLFTVDTSTVTSTLGSLMESYNATKSMTNESISNAQIGVSQAELALSNTQALYDAGAAAEQDLIKAKQGLEQAKIGLSSAQSQQKASLSQIQASIDQINSQASNGTVTAPCAGMVTSVGVVKGGMASSAAPAVVIAADGQIEVTISVAEDLFSNIKKGDKVDVLISSVSKEVIRGTIDSLPVAANAQTSLYDISILLPSASNPPLGAFATVTFYTNRKDDTLAVPTESILTDQNGQYVFILSGDEKTARKVEVTTGLVGETNTEILTGLSAGDLVVTKGQTYLSDGSEVRLVNNPTATDEEAE